MKNQGGAAGAEKGTLEQWLVDRFSPKSLPSYRYGIRLYLSWIGEEASAQMATYTDVVSYLNYLRKADRKPRTISNYLFAVKLYYRWLQQTGRREDHPCARLVLRDLVDRSVRMDKLYSAEQLKDLAAEQWPNPRNQVIVGLLVHQALMVSEVVALLVGDIELAAGEIFVGQSVSNRARKLPLLAAQVLELQVLMAGRSVAEHLILTRYGKALQASSISRMINSHRPKDHRFLPSRIRQSVIAHKLQAGHDTRIVQAFAGHRQLSTTEGYKQDELERLRAGIVKYHPLR
jgi:integrase/recombinase XerD